MTQSPFQRFFKRFLQKLPPHPNKYGIDSVNKIYKDLDKTIESNN